MKDRHAIILQALLNLPLVIYEIFRESGMWVDQESVRETL